MRVLAGLVVLLLGCGDSIAVQDAGPADARADAADAHVDAGIDADARQPRCGDAIVDPGESCDDGNLVSGDGCSEDCASDESCGNGVVDTVAGEQCDDGLAGLSGDGCSSLCQLEPSSWRRVTDHERMPSRSHAAIAFDTARQQLIMFGGFTTEVEGDTRQWNGVTWLALTPATSPPARHGHTLTYDAIRERLILFGGADATGAELGDMWSWDGVTWSELTPPVLPTARTLHGAAFDETRGVLVLFGGRTAAGQRLGDTWEWNGATWSLAAPLMAPYPRSGFAMTYAGSQGILITGADVQQPGPLTLTWDGQQWTDRDPAFPGDPGESNSSTAAYDRTRDRVVAFAASSPLHTGRSREWDGTAWSTVPLPLQPSPRTGAVMSAEASGAVVLFGGVDRGDTWSFDGIAWREEVGTAPPPRSETAMVYDAFRQRLFMFGGNGSTHVTLDDTWEWDGTAWTRRSPATSPSGRYWAGLAFNSRTGRTLLFGGAENLFDSSEGVRYLGDTWEWDGSTWTALSPTGTPPIGPSLMAYDRKRDRVVLLTGVESETWEWDGGDWTRRLSLHSPPTSINYDLAHDERRSVTVLYRQGKTWEWDGVDWHERSPVPSPPIEGVARLTYDATRGTIVAAITPSGLDQAIELWTWDGTTWSRLVPTTEAPRDSIPTITFDAARGELLVFGGYDLPYQILKEPLFETWALSTRAAGPRESCVDASDADGDGLFGCDDPDCWPTCTPVCPPRTSCAIPAEPPFCGDGTCSEIENALICPADC